MENKILCPHCNALECYIESENDINSYLCMSCGYTTNSLFKVDSSELEMWEENTPILIKQSKFVDPTNLVWYPSVLNFPSKGMVFPDGTSELDWKWRVAKIIDIPETERENYPVPGKDGEFYSSKLDIENSTFYERNDFTAACVDLGILEKQN